MEKHHEHLFKMIESHYYFFADRLPSRQDGLFRTYLWSASLALGLSISALQKFTSLSFWSCAAAGAMIVSLVVVMLSLDALRGRPEHNLQSPDFATYLSYLDNPDYDRPELARPIAEDMVESFMVLREAQNLRGLKLRTMSLLLLVSFSLLALAATGFIPH